MNRFGQIEQENFFSPEREGERERGGGGERGRGEREREREREREGGERGYSRACHA